MVAWRVLQVAADGVAQAEVNLKELSDKFHGGPATFSDLLEAEALRQTALERQVDARGDYWQKRSAYMRAIGAEAAR